MYTFKNAANEKPVRKKKKNHRKLQGKKVIISKGATEKLTDFSRSKKSK